MKILFTFCLVFLCFSANIQIANSQLTSHGLSNRRIGYVNDASAVSWNPALLGMVKATDILVASMHDKQFNIMPQYAAFAKFGGLAAGIILPRDSVSIFQNSIPMTIHAGYGFSVFDDYLWIGGGAKYTDDGLNQIRYAASMMLSLHSSFYISGGIDNLYTVNNNHQIMSFMGAYSPLDWLTVHARLLYAKDSLNFSGKNYSPELGISAGILNNFLIGSISFNPTYEQLRLGLEMSLGGISVGTLNNISTQSGVNEPYSYGIAIARLNFSGQKTVATARNGLVASMCHPDELRWKPSFSNEKKDLLGIMKRRGGNYSELAKDLEVGIKNPEDIFDVIHSKHYARFEPKLKSVGYQQSILGHTNREYSVVGTTSPYPTSDGKIVKVRVEDKTGRILSNVNDTSFLLFDSTLQIASIIQANSENPVPVDFVILMDCSGSMGDEINEVRANVSLFVQRLKNVGIDYRLGSLLFGESIFGTLQPTSDLNEFQNFFQQAGAIGMDEITSTAIERATELNFRPNAQRVFILITDECPIQTNGSNTEITLLKKLWNDGVKLYSVVNSAENNGAIMTRLSLGKEFSIRQPFTSILNEIAKDITTTYEIRLIPKSKPIPSKVTMLKGTVGGDDGQLLNGTITLKNSRNSTLIDSLKSVENNYGFVINEQSISELIVSVNGYYPYSEFIDFTHVAKGDTLVKDIVLRKKGRTVIVSMQDSLGNGLQADVNLRSENTGSIIKPSPTLQQGRFVFNLNQGGNFTLISNITDYTCSDTVITDNMFAASDTAYVNVNCGMKDTKIVGAIIDENGASLSCSVTIENILTGEKVSSISTNPKGEFIANVRPGLSYRFTPNKKSYIPQAIEVLSDVTKPGATIPLQLQMIGINKAIADGMTFSLKNIFFDSNKSDIKSESEQELKKLIQFLTENPTVCLEIAAHTDNVGNITDNLALSQRRAESVVNYLQANGIEKLRLKAKGYGESKHIASNVDEAGRLLNRRVEFALFNCN